MSIPLSPVRNKFERNFSFQMPLETQRKNNSGSVTSVMSQLRLSRYFSRRNEQHVSPSSDSFFINHRPEENFIGIYSPVALVWGIIFLIVPAAYLYIALVLLRELCRTFPETLFVPMQHYAPWLSDTVTAMHQVSRWVEIWCCLEGIFYIGLKLYIRWLQTRDPLEASLSAAPMMELTDRRVLWQRMMECEEDDPVSFIRGWFFDQKLEVITKYDVRDFLAWSLFEGRQLEHLTEAELRQLERFIEEFEHRLSLHLHGELGDDDDSLQDEDPTDVFRYETGVDRTLFKRRPRKVFQFAEESNQEEPKHFSELFERFRKAYEEQIKVMTTATADFQPVQGLRKVVSDATFDFDFHPAQELRNLISETGKTIGKAEESAMATASLMYESLVPAGSTMDKQIAAVSHATYTQVAGAWNSVKHMKEWLETARSLQKQRQRIRQQLKGYRELLNQMRDMSSAVPSKQMASMMKRITECNLALQRLENRAQTTFAETTGFTTNNLPFLPERTKPVCFAKYSSDPLLGLAIYPLWFHLFVFSLTEIPLRGVMYARGFERCVIGSVAYYFHPGTREQESMEEDDAVDVTPIVFVHGIGLGLLPYLPLIDALLETGRPILLPEIPYVSGFRPFQSPNTVLPPAVVCSTMTAMLASHGYLKATWMGHSYGTSWLSYMCKYAPKAVASLLFLDPICFCLHVPYLTKQFVYLRPDPGTVSYMVRTDIIVNWTIQRSFPWAHVTLFTEQILVPTVVLLSEKDALVPSRKIESYFRRKNIPVQDFDRCKPEFFANGAVDNHEPMDTSEQTCDDGSVLPMDSSHSSAPTIVCGMLRGDGHGGWTERPAETMPLIVEAAMALCRRAEELDASLNTR